MIKPQAVTAVRVQRGGNARVETLPTPSSISHLYQKQTSLDPAWQDQHTRRDTNNILTVTHSLSLGASPMLHLAWQADDAWYRKGYRVEMFHGTTGFANLSTLTPLEQLNHGSCVGESHENGHTVLPLNEGQSFMTLLLISQKPEGVIGRMVAVRRQRWTGSPVKVAALVRFSIVVPSLRLANDRITQQSDYNDNVVKNITARVKLTSASGELDLNWYVARHEADVRRQTEELLATWRGIETAFARDADRIKADETLTPSRRAQMLLILQNIRLSKLRSHQIPVVDGKAANEE